MASFDDRYGPLREHAAAWVSAGFTLDEALQWVTADGGDAWSPSLPAAAAPWRGITDPEDAACWHDDGILPETASEWVNAGFDHSGYASSRDYPALDDLTPVQVGAWVLCGFDMAVAADHVAAGRPSPLDTLTSVQERALDRAWRDVNDGHITVWQSAIGVPTPDRSVNGAPECWWEFLALQGRLLPPDRENQPRPHWRPVPPPD